MAPKVYIGSLTKIILSFTFIKKYAYFKHWISFELSYAGIVCGAAQAIGVKIFTQDSVNEALNLKSAADACKDELPNSIGSPF